jgi:putative tryptophan/tyrosine transport system substrate-binding protein
VSGGSLLPHLLTSAYGTKCKCRRVSPMTAIAVESGLRWGAQPLGSYVCYSFSLGSTRAGKHERYWAVKRREFITLLGGAAAAWPLAVRAQQAGKLPTIGYLGSGTPAIQGQWTEAFVQRLRELGWIEGRTVAIEYRWAEGRNERYAAIAGEFVRRKVDVIVAIGNAVVAAKEATTVIPIVFPVAADPVGSGLVASLARPGGNVTGLSVQFTDLAGKRVELLRELVAGLRRLAIMVNAEDPGAGLDMRAVQAAASAIGLDVVTSEIRQAEDITPAFETLKGRADALYVCGDALVNTNRIRINTLAVGARLPTMHGFREYVQAGGLMSYGPNFPDLFRRASDYVDKILRGAKPSDIPVEQPTKFDLVVNLTTAKALDLTLPPMLLARADEVIE